MQHSIKLTAGRWTAAGAAGAYFALLDLGAVQTVELRVMGGASAIEEIRTARRGMKGRASQRFTGLEFRSAADTTVEVLVSEGAIDLDGIDGATVNANIQGLPLPVSNDRGTPALPMSVTAVTVNDAPATGAAAVGPVACGPAAVQIVAAAANRRELRITNIAGDPVAIVPPGGSWAARVVVLNPGDTWVEDRGANLAWHGITDAGKAATVAAMALTA